MDLKVTEKKDEPISSRVRLTGEIAFEKATPPYEEVKKKIAVSLNCDERLIVIKNIYTKFGAKKADLLAYLYNNEEHMKRIEPKQKEKKEAKAAEKPAEKPKEEPKEKSEEKEKPKENPEENKEEKKE